MTDGLKECPFCGGEDVFQYVDPHDITYTWEGWTVITECECGAKVRGRAKTEKQAYKASSKKWNTRHKRTCGEIRGDVYETPDGTSDDIETWCEHCDIVLDPDWLFCPNCGAEVVDGE